MKYLVGLFVVLGLSLGLVGMVSAQTPTPAGTAFPPKATATAAPPAAPKTTVAPLAPAPAAPKAPAPAKTGNAGLHAGERITDQGD